MEEINSSGRKKLENIIYVHREIRTDIIFMKQERM